jgi:DNA-binding response OmpR family regulator
MQGCKEPRVSASPLQILVVEDEAVIRSQIALILQEEGYRVQQAADAAEAYELLMTESHLDLVITDVRLPGAVDGAGFAKIVEKLHPGLPILAVSGGQRPSDDDMPLRAAFLPKPILADELVFIVKALLARPRAEK